MLTVQLYMPLKYNIHFSIVTDGIEMYVTSLFGYYMIYMNRQSQSSICLNDAETLVITGYQTFYRNGKFLHRFINFFFYFF